MSVTANTLNGICVIQPQRSSQMLSPTQTCCTIYDHYNFPREMQCLRTFLQESRISVSLPPVELNSHNLKIIVLHVEKHTLLSCQELDDRFVNKVLCLRCGSNQHRGPSGYSASFSPSTHWTSCRALNCHLQKFKILYLFKKTLQPKVFLLFYICQVLSACRFILFEYLFQFGQHLYIDLTLD